MTGVSYPNEKIMQSLDQPDHEIDRVWAEVALHRALACDEGRMKKRPFEKRLWRNMMRIRFSEIAKNELADACDWYEQRQIDLGHVSSVPCEMPRGEEV